MTAETVAMAPRVGARGRRVIRAGDRSGRRRILLAAAWLSLTGIPLAGCADRDGRRAAEIRGALAIPVERHHPLEPELLDTWRNRDITTERVRFRGRPGEYIPALICYSEMVRTRPLPIILCMPGSPNRKEDLLRPLDLLPKWADLGFLVLSIDRPYQGEREGSAAAAIRERGLARVWGESVYDLMRAVDYAASRPEADPQRIGMLGLSMGGMEALLLAALDPRIGVVVSVAGQLSWLDIFEAGSWKRIFAGMEMTGQLTRAGASGREARRVFMERFPPMAIIDAPIVAPLVAPRPMLIITGTDDPYVTPAAARRTYRSALEAYREHGQTEKLELWLDAGTGHGFSKQMRARSAAWFENWL